MNDDELITAVKESVTGAHLEVPVDRIVNRSRAIRARRRVTGASGALAVAAGAALAVTALLPGGHPAHPQPPAAQPAHAQPPAAQPAHAQLAAWTVVKQADGNIAVTIREWRDPAGLQRTLRADGLPAVVTPPPNPACRVYHTSPRALMRVVTMQTPPWIRGSRVVLVIHPAALPPGLGLSISIPPPGTHPVLPGQMKRVPPGALPLPYGLVQASRQCTGS
jgi:hypothetical protein